MLLTCPYCGSDVIQGVDECESCGQTLTDTHLPVPATPVERALLNDRVKLFEGLSTLSVSPTMPVREVLRVEERERPRVDKGDRREREEGSRANSRGGHAAGM